MTPPDPAAAAHLAQNAGELAGRVALVTGAGRGIGRAVADRLTQAEATVIYGYRCDPKGTGEAVAVARSQGRRAAAIRIDVTDAEQATAAVDAIAGEHGRIDVLVNNAGILPRAPFLELALDEWEAVLRTNLTGCFVVSQAVARVMARQRSGSIVHMSSTNEAIASINCAGYAASKGGVRMLTRQMALELAPLGIRTNAVAPGMVETDLNRRELADPEFRAAALRRIPLGRFVTPDDVAEAVCFLAGDRAAGVNGLTLTVDGGKRAA
jgi:NAD(P)-dependent dehydrogenase (short-subunit alcohol dehydrogenase family)